MLEGSPVSVHREIALATAGTTVVVIDLRRYERWVLDAHAALRAKGVWSVGLTDSMLSPIASGCEVTFVVSAAAVGPFDSQIGTLSVLNLLANGVAAETVETATHRLSAIEDGWTAGRLLTDGD